MPVAVFNQLMLIPFCDILRQVQELDVLFFVFTYFSFRLIHFSLKDSNLLFQSFYLLLELLNYLIILLLKLFLIECNLSILLFK